MARKFKYRKVTIVILITVLIWVWADLAQDEDFTVPHATISVAKSIEPSLWVSFADNESSVSVREIVLKGPASKVAEANKRLKEGELLEFDFDPAREKMDTPDKYTLALLPFLQRSKIIRQLGLTAESCKPESIPVSVVKLVEKPLKVRCIDDNGIAIKDAIIDPTHVKIFVPEDWEGEKLIADVQLAAAEVEQARQGPFKSRPYILLAPDQMREATESVKITLPPEEEKLRAYSITSATIGYVFSPVLQEKCRVKLLNPEDMAMVSIKATDAAKNAYEGQPFQILLYILDGDEKKKVEQSRKVVYDLPQEFVGKDEIMLNQQPVTARFELVPLAPEPGSSPGS
jgi:hypothetical protein